MILRADGAPHFWAAPGQQRKMRTDKKGRDVPAQGAQALGPGCIHEHPFGSALGPLIGPGALRITAATLTHRGNEPGLPGPAPPYGGLALSGILTSPPRQQAVATDLIYNSNVEWANEG